MAWTKRTLPAGVLPWGIFGGRGDRWMIVDGNDGDRAITTDFVTFTSVTPASSGVQFMNGGDNDGTRWYVVDDPGSGGFFRSTDGLVGATWERINADFRGGANVGWPYDAGYALVALSGGRLVVTMRDVSGNFGISTSDDGGVTWAIRHVTTASLASGSKKQLFRSGSLLFALCGNTLSKSVDDGTSWVVIPPAPGGMDVATVLPDGTLFAHGPGNTTLNVSTDSGATWGTVAAPGGFTSFLAATTDSVAYLLGRPTSGGPAQVFYNIGGGWTAYATTGVSSLVNQITPEGNFQASDSRVVFGTGIASETGLWTEAAITPPPPPAAVEIIEQDANASDETVLGGGPVMVESADATDELVSVGGPTLQDIADADDELFGINARVQTETASASEEAFDSAISAGLIEQSANASELLTPTFNGLFDESASADELLVFSGGLTVLETAAASEELMLDATDTMLVTDAADASDATLFAGVAVLEDTADASDERAVLVSATYTESADASDEADDAGETGDMLVDTAQADDGTFTRADSSATVVDAANAYDLPIFARTGLIAWLMNTDTGAASWYSNWPFTGMATRGNKVLAVGPAGLAVLGGDLDDGVKIAARLKYGYNELGGYSRTNAPKVDEQKKRVDEFVVGYVSSGVLNFTVKVQGYSQYRYTMEARTADAPRTNRVKPGKGLTGRYWQVGIENTAGAAFDVSSLSANIATSNRRM